MPTLSASHLPAECGALAAVLGCEVILETKATCGRATGRRSLEPGLEHNREINYLI